MTVFEQDSEKLINKAHILVVDDDRRIRDLVTRYLHDHDFIAMAAQGANEAREIMERFAFDALIVDVMMPVQDGFGFTKELRKTSQIPVLLLTALGEAQDRINGFECGADDYLPKPFEPRELILRLKAILKRTQKPIEEDEAFRIGGWFFNPKYEEIKKDEDVIRLTSVEANLLRALTARAGDAMSREELASISGLDAGERTIDVQVTRLRRKIEEDTKNPRLLQTIRGKGYLLRAEKI